VQTSTPERRQITWKTKEVTLSDGSKMREDSISTWSGKCQAKLVEVKPDIEISEVVALRLGPQDPCSMEADDLFKNRSLECE
jgi:hypothetical protein